MNECPAEAALRRRIKTTGQMFWVLLLWMALALAALLFGGCSQIGTIRLQGAYLMGAGADTRQFSGGVDFVLRDRAARSDGKTIVAQQLVNSPAAPDCTGGGK